VLRYWKLSDGGGYIRVHGVHVAMLSVENSEARYGAVALLLHWSMAVLLIGLAALGLYMVTLPDVGFNTEKNTLVIYHKEFGVLAFVLLAIRLSWRVTQILPRLVESLPEWQKVSARFVQLGFYGLIVESNEDIAGITARRKSPGGDRRNTRRGYGGALVDTQQDAHRARTEHLDGFDRADIDAVKFDRGIDSEAGDRVLRIDFIRSVLLDRVPVPDRNSNT
jgi:hypothetical protein